MALRGNYLLELLQKKLDVDRKTFMAWAENIDEEAKMNFWYMEKLERFFQLRLLHFSLKCNKIYK